MQVFWPWGIKEWISFMNQDQKHLILLLPILPTKSLLCGLCKLGVCGTIPRETKYGFTEQLFKIEENLVDVDTNPIAKRSIHVRSVSIIGISGRPVLVACIYQVFIYGWTGIKESILRICFFLAVSLPVALLLPWPSGHSCQLCELNKHTLYPLWFYGGREAGKHCVCKQTRFV